MLLAVKVHGSSAWLVNIRKLIIFCIALQFTKFPIFNCNQRPNLKIVRQKIRIPKSQFRNQKPIFAHARKNPDS
jgi:hypothetical protein